MARFSLHTVGKDQPGIVARVTGVLADLGANLGESNMTILHGQSAIMLVLDVPNFNDGRLIEGALEEVAEEFNLFVTVCPLPEDPAVMMDGESFLISVDGADRPGIVASVTTALAEVGANVIDLISRPTEHEGQSRYTLRLSVVLPAAVTTAAVEHALSEVGNTLQVDYSLRPLSGELAWDQIG